jgi:hypothetical protein
LIEQTRYVSKQIGFLGFENSVLSDSLAFISGDNQSQGHQSEYQNFITNYQKLEETI